MLAKSKNEVMKIDLSHLVLKEENNSNE